MSLLVTIDAAYFDWPVRRQSSRIPAPDVGQPGARLELGNRPDEQPIAVDLA
jgi:hypothetical protein